MLSPQALFKGLVRRALPSINADSVDNDVSVRLWSRGEQSIISLMNKAYGLAEEGSYFVANSATPQTAITGPAGSAFSATAAALTIYNGSTVTNPVRIMVDYISIQAGATAMSNSTSNTATYWSVVLDSIQRYSSGGTSLVPKNVNMESSVSSQAVVKFGALTTTAASGMDRCLVPQRIFRVPVSATALSLANYDTWQINFGGIDNNPPIFAPASATVQANINNAVYTAPPAVIGPGQTFVFHLWLIANSGHTGGTFIPEVAYLER